MEKELARPRVGVLPPVAVLAHAGGLTLAWWMRADAAYFFSSPTPIELGAEGDYHLDRAVSNRYAQMHGVPTVRGWYVEEKEGSFVVLGVTDTPLLVKRVTFEDENRRLPDGKRPQPRQNPFFARGRLLSRDDAREVRRRVPRTRGVERGEGQLAAAGRSSPRGRTSATSRCSPSCCSSPRSTPGSSCAG